MFKLFVILTVTVVAIYSGPVPIVSEENEINPDGSYRWSYQSGDGSAQQQTAKVNQVPGGEPTLGVDGSASWYDPQGNLHQIAYTANEDGYYPYSADIPQIPAAILKALEWNAAHPEEESS
ncbi:larval cuticle protein III/IV-like [Sitophilus oryzae]|uniref:Larval cuticle protein III/IV-like n=1 Tax=Sitophilus oryzae TaxID=7048 RepID=A0A6J2Y1L2_SITOR|nr:larval cuticle protein III/IV-like [Sitophilus oryzae]